MYQTMIACHECDLLQRTPRLGARTVARCRRCRCLLYRPPNDNLDRPLSFTLAAAMLFIIANFFPIVGLELKGQSSAATLVGTAQALWAHDMKLLGVLVFFTTVAVPAVQLAGMSYLLIPLRMGRVPSKLPLALRVLQTVRPWGMVEVFILGLLVALVKLGGIATVVPGVALWSFGGLLMMIAGAVASFDARAIWARQEFPR